MASTTTSTFQGLGEGKPSSRVLAPPGGGSSISFGADNSSANRMNGNKKNMGSDIFGVGDGDDTSPHKAPTNRNASDIFGTDAGGPTEAPASKETTKGNIYGSDEAEGSDFVPAGKANPQAGGMRSGLRQFKKEDRNPLTGDGMSGADGRAKKNGRGGFNPITGQDYEEKSQASVKPDAQAKSGVSTRPW